MTVSILEAQSDLAGFIHRLAPGEELVLTENDAVVATLKAVPSVQMPKKRPPPGLWKSKASILSDDEDHLNDFAEYMP